MGLDITAYQIVSKTDFASRDEAYDADAIWLNEEQAFADRLDGLRTGAYETSGEVHAFRAGSYSGYNAWRSELARMVGVTDKELWQDESDAAKATPFYELINFSDAEGSIGPKTSARLAKDFDDWRERAKRFAQTSSCGDPDYWMRRYEEWSAAFHLAAERGVVCFH